MPQTTSVGGTYPCEQHLRRCQLAAQLLFTLSGRR